MIQYIIAVDPGKSTGIAIWSSDIGLTNAWECSSDEACDWLRDWFVMSHQLERPAIFAIERFTISMRTVRSGRTDQMWSLEITGLLRHMCRWYGQGFRLQDVSSAKRLSSNDQLRSVGWYLPGKDDANDAVRHVVLARAECLELPPPWV